jgi:hypothetical protein
LVSLATTIAGPSAGQKGECLAQLLGLAATMSQLAAPRPSLLVPALLVLVLACSSLVVLRTLLSERPPPSSAASTLDAWRRLGRLGRLDRVPVIAFTDIGGNVEAAAQFRRPFVIRGGGSPASRFPALSRWRDLAYISRIVPRLNVAIEGSGRHIYSDLSKPIRAKGVAATESSSSTVIMASSAVFRRLAVLDLQRGSDQIYYGGLLWPPSTGKGGNSSRPSPPSTPTTPLQPPLPPHPPHPPLESEFAPLAGDLAGVEQFELRRANRRDPGWTREKSTQVWLNGGHCTNAHYDVRDNFFSQVRGNRTFRLAGPGILGSEGYGGGRRDGERDGGRRGKTGRAGGAAAVARGGGQRVFPFPHEHHRQVVPGTYEAERTVTLIPGGTYIDITYGIQFSTVAFNTHW